MLFFSPNSISFSPIILLTLLVNSLLIPFRVAFLIDFISLSNVLGVKAILNLSPLSSPINCPSIIIWFSEFISVLSIRSCLRLLERRLIFLSIKLLVSSSCNLSDNLSSIFLVICTQ